MPAARVHCAHRLVFIRHGETAWNAEGRLQGQEDVPLNPKGRDQAAGAGRALAKWLAREGDSPGRYAFVASPLARARDTMERARAAMGLPARDYDVDPALMELSFGDWQGLTWPEVEARDPAGAAAREADKWRFTPPRGESYATLAERIARWTAALERDTVAVAHGGVARALFALIGGVEPARAPRMEIWQGRVIVFDAGAYRWL